MELAPFVRRVGSAVDACAAKQRAALRCLCLALSCIGYCGSVRSPACVLNGDIERERERLSQVLLTTVVPVRHISLESLEGEHCVFYFEFCLEAEKDGH